MLVRFSANEHKDILFFFPDKGVVNVTILNQSVIKYYNIVIQRNLRLSTCPHPFLLLPPAPVSNGKCKRQEGLNYLLLLLNLLKGALNLLTHTHEVGGNLNCIQVYIAHL